MQGVGQLILWIEFWKRQVGHSRTAKSEVLRTFLLSQFLILVKCFWHPVCCIIPGLGLTSLKICQIENCSLSADSIQCRSRIVLELRLFQHFQLKFLANQFRWKTGHHLSFKLHFYQKAKRQSGIYANLCSLRAASSLCINFFRY